MAKKWQVNDRLSLTREDLLTAHSEQDLKRKGLLFSAAWLVYQYGIDRDNLKILVRDRLIDLFSKEGREADTHQRADVAVTDVVFSFQLARDQIEKMMGS